MRNEAALEQWKELYSLVLEIKQIEPWKYLSDIDVICVLLPSDTEPYFISILGNGGDTYGVIVYPGYESFTGFVELTNSDHLGITGLYAMHEQDNLTCYFGNREEVSSEQYKVLRELGLSFRGKNQWPYFLSMKPRYAPYIIDSDEIQILINVYRELLPLIKDYISQNIEIDFSQGETVTRFYDNNEKKWKHEVSKLEYMEKSYASLKLDAKHPLIQELKSLPQSNTSIEIDMNYINVTVKEKGFNRPINPKLLVFINHNSGMIINQEMMTPEVNEAELIVNLLLDFITKHNRPKAIHFRLPLIGYLLKDFCLKIQIPLIQNKHLQFSDEFFSDFVKFMGQ